MGGGKSTQLAHLANWLRARGIDPVVCRDPGGTALGDEVRKLLLQRHEIPLGMRAEMLLYMASRAQLVEEVIRPTLERGRVVLCDRFLLANVVYQGVAGGLPEGEIWQVGQVATGGLMPDLTLLLDITLEQARGRLGTTRLDRIEQRPAAYHEAVRRGYLRAYDEQPSPIVLIDGGGDAEHVAREIEREVARVLGQGSRA